MIQSIWGKLGGAGIGLALGGPIGALLGGVAGHVLIDREGAPFGKSPRDVLFTMGLVALAANIAKADEAIHEAEYAYLKEVATIFAFSDKDFERIAARHVRRPDDPYLILDADRGMSDEELKRHYRKLVADNHPDREIAR